MGVKIKLIKNKITNNKKAIFLAGCFLFLFLCISIYTLKFAYGQDAEVTPEVTQEQMLPEPNRTQDLPPEEFLPEEEIFPEAPTEEEPDQQQDQSNQEYRAQTGEGKIEVGEEKISLDLKGIDIIELFRVLSLKTGLTIVPSKNVKGRINLFLNNVTFEDALDVILITQGLAAEHRGNILMIMTDVEYKNRHGTDYGENRQYKSIKLKCAKPKAVFDVLSGLKSDIGKIIVDEASGTVILIDIPEKIKLMQNTAVDLDMPLETYIFDLGYANTEKIETYLSAALTEGVGSVIVDERTGKVVVSDLPKKMKKIKQMIKALDEETQQVFIEAEIVQITLNKEYQKGINWEQFFHINLREKLHLTGTFPVSPSFTPSPALSASNVEMTIGDLASDDFTTTVKLLETFGDTKILSSPKIAATNNEEAKILVGAREAYVTQTLSQAETTTVTSESIEFIDVGVKLNVVPTINNDGYVTIKIKPEVSTVRETLTTSLGSVVPIIETSEAETMVKIRDGSMIMIAGLMKEEKRRDKTAVPVSWIHKIPILGWLFSSRAALDKKTELVIFLRPHIITGREVVAGTSFGEHLPPELASEQMKKEFIAQEAEDIKVQEETDREEDLLKIDEFKDFPKSKPQAGPPAFKDINVEDKLKGLKEY